MTALRAKPLVLDAWSVLAFLEGEAAAQELVDIIAKTHEGDASLLMTVANVGEVWYIVARRTSEREADKIVGELDQLGIEWIDIDWPLAREATRIKSKAQMSYADCFAAALAKQRGGSLITGDTEFKQVEHAVDIRWLKT